MFEECKKLAPTWGIERSEPIDWLDVVKTVAGPVLGLIALRIVLPMLKGGGGGEVR
jgi:hypothetical protein